MAPVHFQWRQTAFGGHPKSISQRPCRKAGSVLLPVPPITLEFFSQSIYALKHPGGVYQKQGVISMKTTTMTEDNFLAARLADHRPVDCWLANGVKLQGTILGFDTEVIFMKPQGANSPSDAMMIFKLQIASIAPASAKDCRSSCRAG